MAVLVSARKLGFRHPHGPWLFRGLSFELHSGSVLTVMGRSGCGKSTLLRILGGIMSSPDGEMEGEIGWSSPDLTLLSRESTRAVELPVRRTALMFQEPRLLPWRTVYRNIAFGIEQLRLPHELQHTRIEEALRRVGVEGLGKRYPSQLSGGQQQRVALARALATGARLLLLDEPFSALDRDTHLQLISTIRELVDSGISIVLVSHNPSDAWELGADLLDLNSPHPLRSPDLPAQTAHRS